MHMKTNHRDELVVWLSVLERLLRMNEALDLIINSRKTNKQTNKTQD